VARRREKHPPGYPPTATLPLAAGGFGIPPDGQLDVRIYRFGVPAEGRRDRRFADEYQFVHASMLLLRISGAASGVAMNFRKALATSGCLETVSTAAANLTVSCNSFGSGPT
jgi:hypothetical protein